MCPYFNRDPTPWQATKSLLHPFLGRRHRTLSHHLSVAVGHIIVARLVSQIHADRKRFLPRFAPCLPPCLLPLRTLWTSVILLHGRFSFCTLSASILGSLPHPAGDRPSHSISARHFISRTLLIHDIGGPITQKLQKPRSRLLPPA